MDFKILTEIPSEREPALILWDEDFPRQASAAKLARFAKGFQFSISHHTFKWRKSGESYYRHDCRCAARAMKAEFDLDIVTAVLIHEFIEDDGMLFEQLEREFNEKIAAIVLAVSKKPKEIFSSREERLVDHIETMHEAILAMWEVAIVKIVDRLENTTDTAGLSDEDKKRLFTETETHFLRLFHWSKMFIPIEFRIIFSLWIQEIEFACDNYRRIKKLPPVE